MEYNKLNKIFFFQPIYKHTIWGGPHLCEFKHLSSAATEVGECWELSGVKGDETLVIGGSDHGLSLKELIDKYGESLLGKCNYERYGNQFPLLIKFISAASDLSVQVHPDDTMARKMGHQYGKTEMWYILDAQNEAKLVSGFSQKITAGDYEKLVEKGQVDKVLSYCDTHEGDVFFIPAGRIHAIGGGNFLLEIQQSSNDTFRVYDYDRVGADGKKRALHIEEAKQALNYEDVCPTHQHPVIKDNALTPIVECKEFTTSILRATSSTRINLSHIDSFSILTATKGKSLCKTNTGISFTLERGMTVLVPATMNWIDVSPVTIFECAEIHI